MHTNSIPELHYLWKWQSKSTQDSQVTPKEPQAPNARTGLDSNTSHGHPKLEQCSISLITNYTLESDTARQNQALQVQSFKGPLEMIHLNHCSSGTDKTGAPLYYMLLWEVPQRTSLYVLLKQTLPAPTECNEDKRYSFWLFSKG